MSELIPDCQMAVYIQVPKTETEEKNMSYGSKPGVRIEEANEASMQPNIDVQEAIQPLSAMTRDSEAGL